MIITLQILGIIALISFIILSAIAVSTLSRMKQTFDKVEDRFDVLTKDLMEIKVRSIIVMDSVNELKNHIIVTLDGFNESNKKVIQSLDNFDTISFQISSTINSLQNTGRKLIEIIQPFEIIIDAALSKFVPGFTATSKFIRALNKGISAFSNKVSN